MSSTALRYVRALLILGRVAKTPADARRLAQKAIDSGEALDRFRRIIEQQGGDPRVVDDVSRLAQVKQRHLVQAPSTRSPSEADSPYHAKPHS